MTIRVPNFKWLEEKALLTIPIKPVAGDIVATEDIEAWVRWAYDCGRKKGMIIAIDEILNVTKREEQS
jgi:hypothetical protein